MQADVAMKYLPCWAKANRKAGAKGRNSALRDERANARTWTRQQEKTEKQFRNIDQEYEMPEHVHVVHGGLS